MQDSLIRTEKQIIFNQVKGVLDEINDGSDFCSITLKVGHDNFRMVNLSMKHEQFKTLMKDRILGEKLTVRFYISSRKKHDRWYTTASVLDVRKEND